METETNSILGLKMWYIFKTQSFFHEKKDENPLDLEVFAMVIKWMDPVLKQGGLGGYLVLGGRDLVCPKVEFLSLYIYIYSD